MAALLIAVQLYTAVPPAMANANTALNNGHLHNSHSVVALQPVEVYGIALQNNKIRIQTGSQFHQRALQKSISVMRLPSPDRLVIDIPNATLNPSATRNVAVSQPGIQRLTLKATGNRVYRTVRATIYVDNASIARQLQPQFEGNQIVFDASNLLQIAGSNSSEPALAFSSSAPKSGTPIPPDLSFKDRLGQLARKILPLPKRKKTEAPAKPGGATSAATSSVFSETDNILGRKLSEKMNILEKISFHDNALYLEGRTSDRLHIKKRFTLPSPSRLVVDIENTVLRNKALKQPVWVNRDGIRQVRLGQFDDSTVRVVIETTAPEKVKTVYLGNESNMLALAANPAAAVPQLAKHTAPGEIETIDLKKINGDTVIRLKTTTPMMHSLTNQNGLLSLDLLNAASRPTRIQFNNKDYPEIKSMQLSALTAEKKGTNGTRFYIHLSDGKMVVKPTVTDDGKQIDLVFSDYTPDRTSLAKNSSGKNFNNIQALSNGKAPFAARIVIDAGHGGKDHGASRSGVREKDLNLQLALMLRETLQKRGFKVYMTRTKDVFLPLPKITQITNSIKPDLFISIHHNASTNPTLNGIETYYYTPQSLSMAKKVHAQTVRLVGAPNRNVRKARFYVIHHTSVPAILCEVGYISNTTERRALQTTNRKRKTVEAIANGVVDYLKTRMTALAN